MRRSLPILVTVALVAMAAVALAQVGRAPRARAAAVAATGPFEISDSGDGRAIFAAAGIAPGESTTGTVSIEDTGPAPVALALRRAALVDTPGLGGGVLSGRLELRVVDITKPSAPVPIYAGPLDSMPEERAGELEPGEARTFEFTATLAEGGAATFQNAVQGAATTVGYSWVASEARGGAPTPGGGGPATGGAGIGGAAARFSLRIPRIRENARRGYLVAWIDCDRTCRLAVRGRLRAGRRRHGAAIRLRSRHLLPAGPRRLRIAIPRALLRRPREAAGPAGLRGNLRFLAVGPDGARDTVRRTVHLRVPRR